MLDHSLKPLISNEKRELFLLKNTAMKREKKMLINSLKNMKQKGST
jgi:hypothetical protein